MSLQVRADAAPPRLSAMPGRDIGDLGCGTGCFSAELGRKGFRVRCVDVTPANLAALERMYPDLVRQGLLTPVVGDLTQIPLETSSLDGAFCMEVLEHIDDDRAAIAEVARVVKPGGVLVVSVPNRDAPLPLVERLGLESVHDRPGPEHHVRPGYEAAELAALLRGAGFEVTSISGVGGPLYRATAGLVSLLNLAYRKARGQDTWTWADIEEDASSLPMKAYAAVFPVLLFLARIQLGSRPAKRSTLVVTARRMG